MSALRLLVGADPEVFVKDSAGKFVTAHGLIPGTKRDPFKVPNGAVQVDGNALEFNIDPAADKAAFIGNITTVFEHMKRMVPGYNVVIEPIALFEDGYWAALPEEVKQLGCDPDFNAYTQDVNPPPDMRDNPWRAAGGHIHVGWTTGADVRASNHFLDCCAVSKQLDYALGAWSLLWDPDNRRREMYGKAGSFRPKPYGMEYRTLSNAWLRHPALTEFVYDATTSAVRALYDGIAYDTNSPGLAKSVIDTGDRDAVKTLWRRNFPYMPAPPSRRGTRQTLKVDLS